MSFLFFFFTAPAPTEIYTLSLHDALPISALLQAEASACVSGLANVLFCALAVHYIVFLFLSLSSKLSVRFCLFTLTDRKSTRLNSSHVRISYAVFCLKKKKNYLTTFHLLS